MLIKYQIYCTQTIVQNNYPAAPAFLPCCCTVVSRPPSPSSSRASSPSPWWIQTKKSNKRMACMSQTYTERKRPLQQHLEMSLSVISKYVQHNPWKHFWKHCVSCVWADICFDGVCPKFAISPQRRMEDERIMKNPPEKKTQSNSFRGWGWRRWDDFWCFSQNTQLQGWMVLKSW